MKFSATSLPGVVLVEPRVFADERGFFSETFRADLFERELGARFVQDNHSRSSHGVLRGLHFQYRRPQGKLVRCIAGEIFDVAVDIRRSSNHFGQWTAARLSADNHLQLYVPPGFAHGFQVLSDYAEVEYKCSDYYDPGGEGGLLYNCPLVAIDWPVAAAILSDKDRQLPGLDSLPDYSNPAA
jgi:dTDP-4-dehydrorhamnose 3,5-epimerase